jgi:uncharacterized membrane protein YphA (DoxX/SURF4 family)
MKNKITLAAASLLGLVFIVFGLNFFLNFIEVPPPTADSAAAAFMGAMYTTGFLTFVKVLEIVGGILVVLPKTRNLGLLILGPIVVVILAFNTFIAPGGLAQPPVILVGVLSAFLLWSAKDSFAKLLN